MPQFAPPHFSPRTVWVDVDADAGGVEQRDLAVEGDGDRSKQPVPHPGFASADEPVVAARRGAVSLGYLRPRRASPEMPKNAVQHPPAINAGNAAWLVRQQRLNDRPFPSVSSYRRRATLLP